MNIKAVSFTSLLLLLFVGCEVTSEKIETWKQSVKGAAKIRAAVRDTGQKMAIRVEAAAALGEMGLFDHLSEDVKSLSAGDRKQIMDLLQKKLITKMEGSNPKASNKIQIQAKDALFSLRKMADDAHGRTLDEKVTRWLLGDWEKRNIGEHSSEKIIKTIGEATGPLLAESVMQGGTPIMTCATHLRKVGSQGARDLGAKNLVALAIKEKSSKVQTFHALGKVGSVVAVKFLEQVAIKGAFEQRTWALRALALFPHPSVIPAMKIIAGDTKLKDKQALLRDEAFTVLEKIKDPRSLDALLTFLDSKEDSQEKSETVRYRAVEAIIAGFKSDGVSKLLEGLPSRYTYKKVDITDYIEKDIRGLGSSARKPLLSLLGSKSWLARLVAVRALSEVGTKQDSDAVGRLKSDKTKIKGKGWEGATIGSEAEASAKKLADMK